MIHTNKNCCVPGKSAHEGRSRLETPPAVPALNTINKVAGADFDEMKIPFNR